MSPTKLLCFQPAPEGTPCPYPHLGQGEPAVSGASGPLWLPWCSSCCQDPSYSLAPAASAGTRWPFCLSQRVKAGLSSFGIPSSEADSQAGLKRERTYPPLGCCSSEAARSCSAAEAKLNFAAPRTSSWGNGTESCCGRAEGHSQAWPRSPTAAHPALQSKGWDTPALVPAGSHRDRASPDYTIHLCNRGKGQSHAWAALPENRHPLPGAARGCGSPSSLAAFHPRPPKQALGAGAAAQEDVACTPAKPLLFAASSRPRR